ncbi:single-stranded DNA-binding protein 3 isoform X2 [Maniola jurtina]|uniref:single-stranded DNA-binding protein 3 isoform X2 n=1 Tax=Aphantopus hyperantus TaxID=2795564 RepID=UPI0015682B73|nr:single-stranded DNA-binding protein 3 isoform X2 [Maniola hyperantus]XP_045782040.1 single-stranded DNA-binding protein 3 isoform X2 [Maniola jurtina]
MYAKGKGSTVPSDAQAREKLALYVYEYLLHVGAQKAAQTFLSEIRWEKNITLGEPPGFLHSWWCVFWDLYCAAPERRDTCEHSSEAKAFHDYGFVNSGYGVNGIGHNAGPAPPNDGMGGGGMPPGFFPNSSLRPSPPAPHPGSQPSPHGPQPQLMGTGQPFIGPWYSGGPRSAVRMGMGNDFNGPPGQGMMGNSLERGAGGGMLGGPRMTPPRPGMGPMSPGAYAAGMRGPPPQAPGMPPMGMGPRGAWAGGSGGAGGGSAPLNYSGGSPGAYGAPPGSNGPPGPPTPIMPSPQDSSNSATIGPGLGGVDGMKSSPGGVGGGGPGTPREDSGSGMGDYNLSFGGPGGDQNDQTESAAILKIKESMQEEAKRFEKDPDHPDYFMQ